MTPNPVIAGLKARCPQCGEGALFCGFLKVCDRCEACGADLSRADSGDGPVVFILLIVGAIGCFGLLFTEFTLHPPVWLQLIIWLPLMGLMILIALQFRNRAAEARRDEGA
jgi:uncharacterized protein (DUF983 family)